MVAICTQALNRYEVPCHWSQHLQKDTSRKEAKAKIYHAVTPPSWCLSDSFSVCRGCLCARWLVGLWKQREQSWFLHGLNESWRKSLCLQWELNIQHNSYFRWTSLHDKPKHLRSQHHHTSSRLLEIMRKSVLIPPQTYAATKYWLMNWFCSQWSQY